MPPTTPPRHRLDTGISPRTWDFCSLAECVNPDKRPCNSMTCPRHSPNNYAETQARHCPDSFRIRYHPSHPNYKR